MPIMEYVAVILLVLGPITFLYTAYNIYKEFKHKSNPKSSS